jgi:hypothetical protein
MSITDNLNKLFAIKAQAEALAVQINALHAGFTAEAEIVAAVLDQSKTYIWQTPEGSKILFFREGKLAINDAEVPVDAQPDAANVVAFVPPVAAQEAPAAEVAPEVPAEAEADPVAESVPAEAAPEVAPEVAAPAEPTA